MKKPRRVRPKHWPALKELARVLQAAQDVEGGAFVTTADSLHSLARLLAPLSDGEDARAVFAL